MDNLTTEINGLTLAIGGVSAALGALTKTLVDRFKTPQSGELPVTDWEMRMEKIADSKVHRVEQLLAEIKQIATVTEKQVAVLTVYFQQRDADTRRR